MSMMWSVRVGLPGQGGQEPTAASGLWWYTGWCRPAALPAHLDRADRPAGPIRTRLLLIWWRAWLRCRLTRGPAGRQ